MAPRAPSKKRGNLRIDAALDAMRPFGFPQKLVRSTVKELLTVYGGEEGWVFVEEGSYTLLIDTILEKLNDGAIEKQENQNIEEHAEASVAGSSSAWNEISSCNAPVEVTMKQLNDVANSAHATNETFGTTVPTYDSENRWWKDNKDCDGVERFRSRLSQSSQAAADAPKINRRKPYYGWISNDDEKLDLVYLEPAPLPEEFAKLLMSCGQRKRKKGWDVMPGDP